MKGENKRNQKTLGSLPSLGNICLRNTSFLDIYKCLAEYYQTPRQKTSTGCQKGAIISFLRLSATGETKKK
jgi:hypothetical protein